ncbi:hypothetical protein DFH05DRAFT_1461369 [Lentinula detonsa]|uniref:Uncharacterized protein n=1 Tax=Lentinula detonsa TaxID=2804962 RepID=A0A9W8NYR8_9AGAR|nr:hypothetical protein DFH05DRAFT_1461369 [Lentinula detonsa]
MRDMKVKCKRIVEYCTTTHYVPEYSWSLSFCLILHIFNSILHCFGPFQMRSIVKAVQPERIMIEVPEAPDKVPSVGTVAVTQGCTRKGYTVLGSMMGLQQSFRQCSLYTIWVSLRSAKKKEVPERRTEPID